MVSFPISSVIFSTRGTEVDNVVSVPSFSKPFTFFLIVCHFSWWLHVSLVGFFSLSLHYL